MPEPSIVKIVISDGGGGKAVFPQDTKLYVNDSVFWLNNTSKDHQPAYKASSGQILWGQPPSPLSPHATSSQVVFSDAGEYSYYCSLHPSETGKITVVGESGIR